MLIHYNGVGKGINLYDAILRTGNRNFVSPLIEKWIDSQSDVYMAKEWDYQRIRMILWDFRDMSILKFFEKHGIDIDGMDEFDRDALNKLLEKTENSEIVKRVIIAFEKDLKHERINFASEMAWNDYNGLLPNKKIDEEIADFFGINILIDAYESEETFYPDGECIVQTKEIIGKCSYCEFPFDKRSLYSFNDKITDSQKTGKIGRCYNCGDSIAINEVADKEIFVLMSI